MKSAVMVFSLSSVTTGKVCCNGLSLSCLKMAHLWHARDELEQGHLQLVAPVCKVAHGALLHLKAHQDVRVQRLQRLNEALQQLDLCGEDIHLKERQRRRTLRLQEQQPWGCSRNCTGGL